MAARIPPKLYWAESLITIPRPGVLVHDVPVTWAVEDRKDLPASAEVLFRRPQLAKRIIRENAWRDDPYSYVVGAALQLFTEQDLESFRDWLKRHEGVDLVAKEAELPLTDDDVPLGVVPYDKFNWRISLSECPEWDLPFKVFGALCLANGRWETETATEPTQGCEPTMPNWHGSGTSRGPG